MNELTYRSHYSNDTYYYKNDFVYFNGLFYYLYYLPKKTNEIINYNPNHKEFWKQRDINENNKPMENEAIERIELAEKELKAAKEALQDKLIPEYVELTHSHPIHWHYGKKGTIYPVQRIDNEGDYVIDSKRYIVKCCGKPSTKEAFDAQNEIIRVPDCIQFEEITKRLGIIFNNDKQVLYYDNGIYNVLGVSPCAAYDGSNFKLTKCERSDLKAGDVAFRTNGYDLLSHYLDNDNKIGHTDLRCIEYTINYCIILNDKEYVFTNEEDCRIESRNYQYWYKVEKIV